MATDMMVWNISREGITERMAVSPDDAWDVPGEDKPLRPDPTRKPELTEAMVKGRLDVSDVNRRMVEEFMKDFNLTQKDMQLGR